MTKSSDLAACYQCLGLEPNVSLKTLEDAYFQIRGQLICSGRREDIPPIQAAYTTLKQHLLKTDPQLAQRAISSPKTASPKIAPSRPNSAQIIQRTADSTDLEELPSLDPDQLARPFDPSLSPLERLIADLAQANIAARVSLRDQTLHLGLLVTTATSQKRAIAQLYDFLSTAPHTDYGLTNVAIVRVYGLEDGQNHGQKTRPTTLWKTSFPLPNLQATADDQDLYSFNNRISNTLIFPGLLLLAFLLNAFPALKFLLLGVSIWIHECGHATVAWLSGYKAIPLPFGWTNVSAEKSLFVYFGVLTLLGLLFWTGQKERRLWPMVLASSLAAVQFYLTWGISADTFDMLLSFGGVGGEFYLSTLLIVSFYFPLPAKWRWDFYRYPTVLMAGFTLIGSLSFWHQIERGLEAIPWGTMLGGSGDAGGDMNRLVGHGWSDLRIVNTYSGLGDLCLLGVVSVYLYFFLKQRNHLFLYAMWRRSRLNAH